MTDKPEDNKEERLKVLEELAAESQSLGLYADRCIKAAAILLESGEVMTLPAPHRHSDIMLMADSHGISLSGSTQGFITSDDEFVDRTEAYKIASEAFQIIHPPFGTPTPGTLYTEDLW